MSLLELFLSLEQGFQLVVNGLPLAAHLRLNDFLALLHACHLLMHIYHFGLDQSCRSNRSIGELFLQTTLFFPSSISLSQNKTCLTNLYVRRFGRLDQLPCKVHRRSRLDRIKPSRTSSFYLYLSVKVLLFTKRGFHNNAPLVFKTNVVRNVSA